MSAPGYQISRDPTAVIGARSAAWIVDALLLFLLALALGPTPLSPLAEYTSTEGLDMTEACERLRDLDEDVNGCVVINDNVYFTDASDALIQLAVSLAAFVLVFVVWQGVSGLTPGKLLLGLRTVGEDGRPPGPVKALVRSVLWIIDGLPCIPVVGFITALTSTGHRRVGDMAAKTFVVAKADLGRPVVVAGLTSGGYGAPTAYPGQPGYGTPMPGSNPWGTPPPSPGGPAAPGAPGAPSWGTPPSAPSAPASPYPAADARPGPPTSPYGTPATPGTPGTPSGGYGSPAPSPGADVTGPTAPGQAPAPAAGSFGESGDPSDADRPASAAAPSAPADADVVAEPAEKADQSEKDGGAREDASPSGSEAVAEPSESASPAASTESAGEPAAAPTAAAPAPSAGSDATVEQTYSPQWDAARGAYIQWDPNRSRWLQWDDTAKEWKPI